MKKLMLSILFVAFAYFGFTGEVFAENSIVLSPSSGKIENEFPVEVRVLSDEPVNAVQVELRYSSEIDVVRVDERGSDFPVSVEPSRSPGLIVLRRGTYGKGVTGDNLVAKVIFEVVDEGAGEASLSVGLESYLVRGSDQADVLTVRGEGDYTVAKGNKAVVSEAPKFDFGEESGKVGNVEEAKKEFDVWNFVYAGVVVVLGVVIVIFAIRKKIIYRMIRLFRDGF